MNIWPGPMWHFTIWAMGVGIIIASGLAGLDWLTWAAIGVLAALAAVEIFQRLLRLRKRRPPDSPGDDR